MLGWVDHYGRMQVAHKAALSRGAFAEYTLSNLEPTDPEGQVWRLMSERADASLLRCLGLEEEMKRRLVEDIMAETVVDSTETLINSRS